MKAKGIRIIANLLLIVGVVACLAGCVVTLVLAKGVCDQPTVVILACLGGLLLAVVLLTILLHHAATVKEKRDRIRACWAVADAPRDKDVAGLDEESLVREESLPAEPAVCYVVDTRPTSAPAQAKEPISATGKVARVVVSITAVALTAAIVGLKIYGVCKPNASTTKKNAKKQRKNNSDKD